VIRRFPLATRVEEAALDAEVELELATLDICDEVRRCGTVGADSMWETFLGQLTADVSAACLHNPVRWQRGEAERARLEQERVAAVLRQRREQRLAAQQQRYERQEQLKRDAESQQERIERTRRESLEAQWRWQRESDRAQQKLQHDTMMAHWRAVVARNGWSEDEAATYWHDWLTGPPGFFG
jgi:hypothetical protein